MLIKLHAHIMQLNPSEKYNVHAMQSSKQIEKNMFSSKKILSKNLNEITDGILECTCLGLGIHGKNQ